MKLTLRAFVLICCLIPFILAPAFAEGTLEGALSQMGYDRKDLFSSAPLIRDVRVSDGLLSFTAGPGADLTNLYAELYNGDGESVASFGTDDFELDGDTVVLKDSAIGKGLELDISAENSLGYSLYSSSDKKSTASLDDSKIVLSGDGSVTLEDEEGRTLVYGRNDMLRRYTFTDENGLTYTFSGSGQLETMTGTVPGIDGTVEWHADSGWYAVSGGEEKERLTDEQIEIALPYAKYPPRMKVVYKKQWYPRNTACVMGLPLRDLYPELTDKWYHVLPVAIDKDGKQTFPLVASNLYFVGSVTVTVRGDWVTVDYSYYKYGDLQDHESLMAWFTDISEITADFLEAPESRFSFRRRVSRQKDLGGQSTALLFVCNRLSYPQPFDDRGRLLTRYWPDHPRYIAYRAGLMEQLNGMAPGT